jgi:hypothetical protein
VTKAVSNAAVFCLARPTAVDVAKSLPLSAGPLCTSSGEMQTMDRARLYLFWLGGSLLASLVTGSWVIFIAALISVVVLEIVLAGLCSK